MKYKILAFLTVLTIVFTCTACSPSKDTPEEIEAGDAIDASTTTPVAGVEATAMPEKEPEPEIGFDLNEYKELVSDCRTKINDACLFVANIGSYEFQYWKNYNAISGRGMPDNMVDSAFEWLAEEADVTRDAVDDDYNNIRQQYKDIILIEIEGREAEEIDAAFRSMYDAYNSMYSQVTSPSTSLSGFGTTIAENIAAIEDADESLSLFLD